ncbi:EAL domain-containing protein, partial [Virgibacillus sp. W0181]|uniref:EAL domain-containing protein n=1 Tax=Virgibacillus sp. W0181 TaxID=3391581 RepID=UPI003F455314
MSIKKFIKYKKFCHYFQPIYNLDNRKKVGYEALIRSKNFSNPKHIFQVAKENNQLYELDSQSIYKAILAYHSTELSRKNGYLFLNILPSTILKQELPSFLEQIMLENNLQSQQIVLEISESEIIKDFVSFKKQLRELKIQGFLIAIDDVGKGFSDMQTMIELEADYLKLDRY